MQVLQNEIYTVNNPALGAYLLWKYAIAYRKHHCECESSPGVLAFLVLPMIFHKPTLDFLQSTQTRTGLAKFSEKFLNRDNQKSDLLLKIHNRAKEMRNISLHSMSLAVTKKLIALDSNTGRTIPYDVNTIKAPKEVPAIIGCMEKNSEKLGAWFAKNSLRDISFYLKVGF